MSPKSELPPSEDEFQEASPVTEEEIKKAIREGKYIDTSEKEGVWLKDDKGVLRFEKKEPSGKAQEFVDALKREHIDEMNEFGRDVLKGFKIIKKLQKKRKKLSEALEKMQKLKNQTKSKEDLIIINLLMEKHQNEITECENKIEQLMAKINNKWKS
ncbi:MAG: hypothetical protein UR31_C0025G0009 [Parcubacteria group bacterium GW2011_GWA2_33_14]|uniref:Uncharacterized protein n=1 Tax=Candidatus Staskawiczbacteria bacterium RIFCSPHIGHO2_02_FULL_33_16 TaxID=1802204 RepID=A0A1G2HXN2_9BACT|nr:MAG: hypothetical protein UR31_C0025G0009 [Parcubacteria group bacterium GW2011_GWA2_33_14]OGZ67243.1 MAG: hypothetical protein A3D34_00460 [Candidatus Staskawiczbacteria bacterium RIFCSPHIGHO2_02_FULL_33_16]OGZ70909.1 MAG: hypothetical protein A2980_02725 [Candidatus Staskawiczbacteria bacterium RIFCSPLOWO2_01_FULL_33_13]